MDKIKAIKQFHQKYGLINSFEENSLLLHYYEAEQGLQFQPRLQKNGTKKY